MNEARAKRDAEANENTMLAAQTAALDKFKAALTSEVTCVRLNGTAIPFDIAKQIVEQSKDLRACKAKVQKEFEALKTKQINEIAIGNYKVELVKGA